MTADGAAAGHRVNEEPGDIMLYADTAYTGEIGIELATAGATVREYLAAHEDVFAGGHYSSDCSHCVVCIAKPHDPAVQGLHQLITTLGDQSQLFIFEQVERSWTNSQKFKCRLSGNSWPMSPKASTVLPCEKERPCWPSATATRQAGNR